MTRTFFSRLRDRPALTISRVRRAYAIAIATDLLQIALGPFGWAFVDEALDVVAMLALSRTIGFHLVLLPTFALEFLPLTDMLPTWTASVALVVALRRREQVADPSAPSPGPVIDV